jgi:hypothetical protein
VTARIRFHSRGGSLAIPDLAASNAICTTLVLAPDIAELPTLVSVERIIAHLARQSLIVRDPQEIDTIALLVNERFLTQPPARWRDEQLVLGLEALAPPEIASHAFGAVTDVRAPVLRDADSIISTGRSGWVPDRLVDEIGYAVDRKRPIWKRLLPHMKTALTSTMLGVLVDQLVGIPLGSIISLAVHNGYAEQ